MDVAEIARRKIAALQQQIAELEEFLRVHDALASESASSQPVANKHRELVPAASMGVNGAPKGSLMNSGDKAKVQPYFPPRRPDAIAQHMERIIREVGKPMTRTEIVEAFTQRDIHIPYEDKAKYVGTIAWRHKATFENIKDHGYWLRGEPLPRRDIFGESKPRPRLTPVEGGDEDEDYLNSPAPRSAIEDMF